jgi:hypothetical protein
VNKYSKKVTLTAVEISQISICVREAIRWAKKENNPGSREYIEQMERLQKKFQRLAVNVEKEVMQDIKEMR